MLTQREEDVIFTVEDHKDEFGEGPRQCDIAARICAAESSASRIIKNLVKKGYLELAKTDIKLYIRTNKEIPRVAFNKTKTTKVNRKTKGFEKGRLGGVV